MESHVPFEVCSNCVYVAVKTLVINILGEWWLDYHSIRVNVLFYSPIL